MAASPDIYPSQFPPSLVSDDGGPQSSEEGSGLHSPVSYPGGYHTHGDNFRYQHDTLDVQQTAGMIATQYDFGHSLDQQEPMLESLSSSARHDTFPNQYPTLARNHLGLAFSVQSPVSSRISPAIHGGPSIDFRPYSTTERRLPCGSSHDHSHNRSTGTSTVVAMNSDHRPSIIASSARSEPPQNAAQSISSTKETRKEISSAVIACRQCRARKIRCDSTKPVCNNCVRRSNDCQFDLVPKRRGPDKRPGTRQRSCKKRPADGPPPPPKRKRTAVERPSDPRDFPSSKTKDTMQEQKPIIHRQDDRTSQETLYPVVQLHSHQTVPSPIDHRIGPDAAGHYRQSDIPSQYRRSHPQYPYEDAQHPRSTYHRQTDMNTFHLSDPHRAFTTPTSPTAESDQKDWWNRITRSYTIAEIHDQVQFLIQNTGHLLSFINDQYLLRQLSNEADRARIQPAFILACLAMAKLMQSSVIEEGHTGLNTAMALAKDAKAAMDDSWARRWVDPSLAEAALILALFESSAYPHYSPSSATSSLLFLDSLIRTMGLTSIDNRDPGASSFPTNGVPTILCDSPILERKCMCINPTNDNPSAYYRSHTLPWSQSWAGDQIRDERIRRLSWSALSLISEHVAQCYAFNEAAPRFFVCDPANFRLLFPNEIDDRMNPNYRHAENLSQKETVWALYCRSMLLWNFCNRFRQPSQLEERAEQAQEAFLEVAAIEDALNIHDCNLDTSLMYTCREYIHNIRMLVAQGLRSFHGLDNSRLKTTPGPMFKRKHAEDWLFYQDQVIQRTNQITNRLNPPESYQFTRRPFRINWFIHQLAICLVLWNHDPELLDALKLAKLILVPIDVMNALWPCPAMQQRCDALRQQLHDACSSSGIEPPFPPNYSVPSFLQAAR